jgi:pyruvate/2-oxoglutarate dehydrogenase complex dihydrolipoamide acyltransferase (E2) component
LVNVGDRVEAQQSLCVVESDKASVEVPSSVAGIVKAIHVSANQEVRQGMALATIEVSGSTAAPKLNQPLRLLLKQHQQNHRRQRQQHQVRQHKLRN